MGLGLKPVKIKMMPNETYAFVTFRCEEDRKVRVSDLKQKHRCLDSRSGVTHT